MQDQSKFQDPKILLTYQILDEMQETSDSLNQGEVTKAGKRMAFLLRRIEIADDEKEMRKLHEDLTPQNYLFKSYAFVYDAYEKLNAYLNRTYYADFKRARPK